MSEPTVSLRSRNVAVHHDERGALLPVELGEVGFDVQRVFVVTAPDGGADRGGHRVPCRELVVLVGGRAEVRIAPAPGGPWETVVLERPGAAVELLPGESMEYRLTGGASVLVLADAAYGDW